MDMKELGFTKEELQERVIDRVCDRLLRTPDSLVDNQEGDDEFVPLGYSELKKGIETKIKIRIDRAIEALADKHITPNVGALIEGLTLRKTNEWGEKKETGMTFVEYLTDRARAYMGEAVDYEGKTVGGNGNHYGKTTQTRLVHLVDKHLHYEIQQAMAAASTGLIDVVKDAIQSTVKLKLSEFAANAKLEIKTR